MRAVNSPAMEARGIRLQGELGISRNTIARGMPGCSGCTCMLVCAFLSASCTRDRGCQPAPGIPCALRFLEGKLRASLGCNAPRECGGVFGRHRRLCAIAHWGGRSSIPETAVIIMAWVRIGCRGHNNSSRMDNRPARRRNILARNKLPQQQRRRRQHQPQRHRCQPPRPGVHHGSSHHGKRRHDRHHRVRHQRDMLTRRLKQCRQIRCR